MSIFTIGKEKYRKELNDKIKVIDDKVMTCDSSVGLDFFNFGNDMKSTIYSSNEYENIAKILAKEFKRKCSCTIKK